MCVEYPPPFFELKMSSNDSFWRAGAEFPFPYSPFAYMRESYAILSFFLYFFSGNDLTKVRFGCILYDIGSIWSRCSPQNAKKLRRYPGMDAEHMAEEKSKNLRESV